MLSTDFGSHPPGERELTRVRGVVAVVVDRKCAHRLALTLGKERCVRRRVDSAGQEDTDGYVAHLRSSTEVGSRTKRALRAPHLSRPDNRLDVIPDVPPHPLLRCSAFVHPKPRARFQLPYVGEERKWSRGGEKRQVVVDGFVVDAPRVSRVHEDRLDLRAKCELAACGRKERGLIPMRSRASQSWRVRPSQIARPNMPRNRSRQWMPHSSNACTTVSVSE